MRRHVVFALAALLFVLQRPTTTTDLSSDLTIVSYQKVATRRVSRDVCEFDFKAVLRNRGGAVAGAEATLTRWPWRMKVIDGTVTFGPVASRRYATSADTFTVRQACSIRCESADLLKDLRWKVTRIQASIADLRPGQLTLAVGGSGSLTVKVQQPESSPMVVTLTSSDPLAVAVPPSVTVPAGQTAASFVVSGLAPAAWVAVRASLNGTSAKALVAVLGRPAPPVLTEPLVEGATVVGGTGIASAIVTAQVDGVDAGTQLIPADGQFVVAVPMMRAAQVVTATQSVLGLVSLPSVPVTVRARPPAPTLGIPLLAGSVVVRGHAAADAGVQVFINGAAGGVGAAGADGLFAVAVPTLTAGEVVTAIQIVAGIESIPSAPVTAVAVPPPPVVATPVIEGSEAVSGTGLPGARVDVFLDGSPLGSANVGDAGAWTLTTPTLVAGQAVTARQVLDLAVSAPSSPVVVTARPPAPSIHQPLIAGTTTVAGTGVANALLELFVNDTAAGTTTVRGDGTWSVATANPLLLGQAVTARQVVNAIPSLESAPVFVVALPPAPIVSAPLVAGETGVGGTGSPAAAIQVFIDGVISGETTVGGDGRWSITLDQPLVTGEQVTAYQVVAGLTSPVSDPVVVVSRPPAPVVTAPIIAGATTVSGSGVPGASLETLVDGGAVGTTAVGTDGSWSLPVAALTAGQVITARQSVAGIASALSDPVIVQGALLDVAIAPAPAVTIVLGQSQPFVARGTFSDGSVQEPLAGVHWTSSDPSVASISPDGLVVGESAGVAQIAASRDGVASAATSVTVVPPAGNLPPVVDAGADLHTTLLATTALSGAATDDGLPAGVLAVHWQKVSGPGDVTFLNDTVPQAQAIFHRLGTYVLRLTADDSVLQANDEITIHVVCPAGPYPQGPLVMCDDFERPDGTVGNGWSTWHGDVFGSPNISIAEGRLSTRGYPNRAGGVYRTLPVTLPATFSFEQQASFDGTSNACSPVGPYNEIAWGISFNATGVPPNTPIGSNAQQQVNFTQYAGSRRVIRWHWNGSAMTETSVPNLPEPIPSQRDFQPAFVARVEGVINPDLSATITVFYNDGQEPPSSTFEFPAVPGAPFAAPGATLSFGNNTCNPGITYYDNLDVRADAAPSLVSVDPALSAPGRAETVLITGLNTHFVDGTSQARFGTGISVGGAPAGEFGPVTVLSPMTATARLLVAASADLGGRQVLVRTGSELVTFGTSIQILPDFNATGELPHVVHLGDNLNDIRFLPPDPSDTSYRAGFRLPSAPAPGSVPILLVDQYQADNSNPADRSFVAVNGTRLGALSLNSLIVPDLRGATSIPVVTDTFSLRGIDLVGSDVEVLVQAGDVHIGPPDTFDDLDITNIRVSSGFAVVAPALRSVSPESAPRGERVALSIQGDFTHFEQGLTAVSAGAGITVNSVTVADSTSLGVDITVAPTAPLGPRAVTVTTGTEVVTRESAFTVVDLAPAISQVAPSTGVQGQSSPVTIEGVNTHFVQGQTSVEAGPGISISNVVVTCATCLSAVFNVSDTAAVGPRTVSVTTGTETAVRANGFSVLAGTPTLTALSPSTGTQGAAFPITVVGRFTHFEQGVTTVALGSGITLNNVTVLSPTLLTAQLGISVSAVPGSRALTVTTGAESVNLDNAFTVLGVPTLVAIGPARVFRGQSVRFVISGLYTHFASDSTVNLGAGISVTSVTALSATNLVVSAVVACDAAFGARGVTVTTGDEVLSLPVGAFAVEAIAGDILAVSSNTRSILRFGSNGSPLGTFVTSGSGGLVRPIGVTIGPDGNLYVPDYQNGSIKRYSGTTGAYMDDFIAPATGGLAGPIIGVFGPDGDLYVTDNVAKVIRRYDGATRQYLGVFSSGGLAVPTSITFGLDGQLYVADEVNVKKFDGLTGALLSTFIPAGTGGLSSPSVITQGCDANWYVSSAFSGVLRFNGVTGAYMPSPVAAYQGERLDNGFAFGPDNDAFVGTFHSGALTDDIRRYDVRTGQFLGTPIPPGAIGSLNLFSFRRTDGPPELLSVKPNRGAQGQRLTVDVTGRFTQFVDGVTTAEAGDDVTVVSVSVQSPTRATVVLDVSAAAAPGSRAVSVITGSEFITRAVGFTVQPNVAPLIAQVTPATGQLGQQNILLNVLGQNTHFVQGTSQVSLGPGVTVAGVTIVDETHLTAQVSIDTSAALGPRTLTVTTGPEIVSRVDAFTVAPVATLSRIDLTPNVSVTLTSGQTFLFSARGTFSDGSVEDPLSGLTWASSTPAIGSISSAGLATGVAAGRASITASRAGIQSAATEFNVKPLPIALYAPILGGATLVDGAAAEPGASIQVAVNGVPRGPSTTADASGAWSVAGLAPALNVGDSVTARQTVNGMTSDVSLPVVVSAGAPALVSISPASGTAGQQNLLVVLTGVFTHFVQGSSQVAFAGTAVTINSVTVLSPTLLSANISIAANALTAPRTVTVTTGAEVVSLPNAFTVQPGVNQSPAISIAASWAVTLPNRLALTYTVTDDGLPIGGTLTTSWETVSGPGEVGYQDQTLTSISVGFAEPGLYVLRVTATDTQFTVSEDVTVTVSAATGGGTLVAAITSPAEGGEITAPVAVLGTATGPGFASWTLEIQGAGETAFRPIATGTNPVTDGPLGTLDPTLLLNGLTALQLRVSDVGGNTATYGPVTVVVAQNQKVGNFTVSFTDVSVPVAGLPIQVIRTYDSRDKRPGDFGIGWRLALQSVTLSTNGPLGEGWAGTRSGGTFSTYCITPTRTNVVTVSFTDGSLFQFQPQLSPQCQQLSPPLQTTVSFRPVSTTPPNVSLAIVGNATAFVPGPFPGTFSLLDEDLTETFNPTQFRLTMPDGRVLELDAQAGLQRMSDLNGNALTMSAAGVTHSSGRSVTFQRDAANRITRVTDPAGRFVTYAYDVAGDLASVTDATDNTTTFTYNASHGLLTIVDPRGIQPIRNEYNDAGRLVRHIDAFGNVISYTHDLNTRQEIVTDRLNNVTINEYDERGNVVRVTDASGGVTTRAYDARNNVRSETDPLGRTRTFTYDANDNRLTERDPLGNSSTYTYNARNQVLTIRDPRSGLTTNVYDDNGNLQQTTDALGQVTSYDYNVRGQQTSVTDPLNQTTISEYDSAGNLTRQTDALGRATTYTYDANGNRRTQTQTRTTATGPETLTTQYGYDGQNRLIRTTFPDGTSTRTVYNAIGKQESTFDQLDRETRYEYDLMGRLTRTAFPDGTSESSTYDAEGRRLSSTDRGGRITRYVYDGLGRLTQTLYADNTSSQTEYDAGGQVLRTVDARGNPTTFGYDTAGRRTSVTDARGSVTQFQYDEAGNQLRVTDANTRVTQFTYDALNRRTRTTYPDTTNDTVVYDAVGRTIRKIDQAGVITQYEYDALGRLTAVVDARNQRTTYGYDEIGNRVSQTDARGRTTRFGYDGMGRRTSRTLPLGQTERMTYHATGTQATKTDFNGRTTTYQYDRMNRLTAKIPDAFFAAPTVSFSYGPTGQRMEMVDASGTTTYAYDERDRLRTKATPQGTLTYTYNEAGRLASIRSSNASGTSVDYAYDELNRLSTVTDTRLTPGVTTYAYDNVGNLASYTYPNSVTHRYTYSALNRLEELVVTTGTTPLASFTYTLGPTGNRTRVVELGGRQVDYGYDELYRLTQETITSATPSGTTTYAYDEVGNRLSRSSPTTGLTNYSYDENDRLATDSYDDNGNTTASGGAVYTYDFENRLVSQNNGAVTVVYDGDGNRVAKTVSGVTTRYLVDDRNLTGYAQVLEESTDGSLPLVYTYGLDLISQSQANSTSFYGYDGHGSVRLLTDSTGAVADRYDYDAFGNALSQTRTTPNVYLYSGEQYDSNLGLLYLRARYLAPDSGRFVSMDRFNGFANDPNSLHRYVYAHGNPVMNHDPSGNVTVQEAALTTAVVTILSQVAIVNTAFFRATSAVLSDDNHVCDGFLLSCRGAAQQRLGPFGVVGAGGIDFAFDVRTRSLYAAGVFEFGLSPLAVGIPGAGLGWSVTAGIYGNTSRAGGVHDLEGLGLSAALPLRIVPYLGLPFTGSKAYGLARRLADRASQTGRHLYADFGTSVGTSAYSFTLGTAASLSWSATITGGFPFLELVNVSDLDQSVQNFINPIINTLAGTGCRFADLGANPDTFLSAIR